MWCPSVCSKGQLCKQNPGSCEFTTAERMGPSTGKCGLEDRCPFKVTFSTERKKGGKQSGGDQFSVSWGIFDHSLTCAALGASSQELTKSMVHNSPVAHSMLSSCKNVNLVISQNNEHCGTGARSIRWCGTHYSEVGSRNT